MFASTITLPSLFSQCVVDAQGDPTDELSADAIDLVAALGSSATKVSQIVDNQDRAVFSEIQEGIDRANKGAVSTAQTVRVTCTLIKTLLYHAS